MNQAYHLSETNSKQNLSLDGHLEYQGIKYRYYSGEPAVKDEKIIQRMVAEYARLLDESKEYDDYDRPYSEGYLKGSAAGMSLALVHLGIKILHPKEDQQ